MSQTFQTTASPTIIYRADPRPATTFTLGTRVGSQTGLWPIEYAAAFFAIVMLLTPLAMAAWAARHLA